MSKIFAISYPAKMVPTHCDKISWQNFGFSSSIKHQKDAFIDTLDLIKTLSFFNKKQQQRFRYVCDFLQLIRPDFPLNPV